MEKIMNWYEHQCEEASFNRLGVMAFVLIVQTCFIIPATLLSISLAEGSFLEFALMVVFSFSLLVVFLGDVTVKISIPLFVISTLVHLAIFASNML